MMLLVITIKEAQIQLKAYCTVFSSNPVLIVDKVLPRSEWETTGEKKFILSYLYDCVCNQRGKILYYRMSN